MEKDSQIEIYKAQAQMEQDSLDVAVKGDANVTGFTDIIRDYGGTSAANNALG